MADAQSSAGQSVARDKCTQLDLLKDVSNSALLRRYPRGAGNDPQKRKAADQRRTERRRYDFEYKRKRHLRYLKVGSKHAGEINRRNIARCMADPVEAEKVREGRRKRRQRTRARNIAKGLTEKGAPRVRTPTTRLEQFERAQARMAHTNALQAWRHWLGIAPNKWMRSYYRAIRKPWANPRLTDAQRWRIRYWLDVNFRAKELDRINRLKVQRALAIEETDDGTLTGAVIVRLYAASKVCPYCDCRMPSSHKTLDHMTPFARGGRHSIANALICCRQCNTRKQSKPFIVWLHQINRLHLLALQGTVNDRSADQLQNIIAISNRQQANRG